MDQALIDYYRCPEELFTCSSGGQGSHDSIYAENSETAVAKVELSHEALQRSSSVKAIDDLRFERYVSRSRSEVRFSAWKAAKRAYYWARPLLSAPLRRQLQNIYFTGWKNISFPAWPIDRTVDRIFEALLVRLLKELSIERIPFIWFWPEGAQSCAIMTHDVETVTGRNACSALMDLDESVGIKSSFQIVPEGRYEVSQDLIDTIRSRGFEVNIQDLNHDGRLFDSREQFQRRVEQINFYGKKYNAKGFRAAVLYREADWYDALNFSYDMSIPTVGHLEVQRGGCCTVMPFFIGRVLELPVSTIQDYSLFSIIRDYSIELWKRQTALIQENHGLASFIVHPDYVTEARALHVYKHLLKHLTQKRDTEQMWIALPGEVDHWWRSRSQMKLIPYGNTWRIEGAERERACLAYASLDNDQVVYNMA